MLLIFLIVVRLFERNRKFLKPFIENIADHFVEISTKQNGNAENNMDEASSYCMLLVLAVCRNYLSV